MSKKEDLQKVVDTLNKTYGAGTVMWLSDNHVIEIDRIKTGIQGLDKILGGGLPRGRIVEIYGPESSGKTSIAIQTAINEQTSNPNTVIGFVDAEFTFDKEMFILNGGDEERLVLLKPDSAEDAWQMVDVMLDSNMCDLIVLDSIAALVPKKEYEGQMGDSNMGVAARLNNQALRKITGKINKTKTCLILINQTREKIGVVYGNPTTTPGGNGIKFAASIRLEVKKKGLLKEGDQVTGHNVHVKTVKNKTFSPFKECEYEIIYESGINFTGEVFRYGIETGAIKQGGAWFTINIEGMEPEKIQGKDKVIQFLNDNPEIYNYIANL